MPPNAAPSEVAISASITTVETLQVTIPCNRPSARRGPPDRRPATQAPIQIETKLLTRIQMAEPIAGPFVGVSPGSGCTVANPTATPSNVNIICKTIVTNKPAKIAPQDTRL